MRAITKRRIFSFSALTYEHSFTGLYRNLVGTVLGIHYIFPVMNANGGDVNLLFCSAKMNRVLLSKDSTSVHYAHEMIRRTMISIVVYVGQRLALCCRQKRFCQRPSTAQCFHQINAISELRLVILYKCLFRLMGGAL